MDPVKHLAVELRRHGFVTRAGATEAGLSDGRFGRAAKRLGLTARYRGLWVPDEGDQSLEEGATAALTTIPEPALLTGGRGCGPPDQPQPGGR